MRPKTEIEGRDPMTKIRRTLVGVAIIGSVVSMMPRSGFAEPIPTAEERSACTSDAFRLCVAAIPNQSAVIACSGRKGHNSARPADSFSTESDVEQLPSGGLRPSLDATRTLAEG